MNSFTASNADVFTRPRARIVLDYSEVQRSAQQGFLSICPEGSSPTIGSFETDWPDKLPFELDVLSTIMRQGTGLALSRAEAEFPFSEPETWPVGARVYAGYAYRLASGNHHAHFTFTLEPFRAGFAVNTLMLKVEQPWRGSFFGLRSFLIDEVAGTLFGLKSFTVHRLIGHASSESMPSYKLVRLYQRLGAVMVPDTAQAVMLILNPKVIEFLEHCYPQGANYIKEAKARERKRVPPLPKEC
ncbi:MAG TPA: hypothetical protein P5205_14540 [Candidatus Paceibacterota bacterium]|nr:hypothetical protein [Verrucomicrobiota bacterium]HSA11581.1 hypothetical protein [Candidatus Paceibacterota bacterium]